jgi:CheY-like chemotaxis protein
MASKKLLVADDSLTIQKVIRLALSGAAAGSGDSYDIQAVSDGNDAIQQISLFRPEIVLIDVSLPGKSAFEVKRAINEHRDLHGVRFVLMSSAFEKVDEKQAGEVEFHGRLTKPFDPAHLREVLSEVLSQEPHREPTLLLRRPSEPPAMPPSLQSEMPPALPPEMPPSIPPEMSSFDAALDLPPPPPYVPGSGRAESNNDDDIRNLTESTIRMAGLDDFQWSVQEPSLKPPAPPEAPSELTIELSQKFEPELPPELPPELLQEEVLFTPPPPIELPIQFDEVSDSHSHEAEAMLEFDPPIERTRETPRPPAAPTPTQGAALTDEVIRREVERAVQEMARRILPEVAERLIKEEIRRLLSN